jgi:flagellar hook-associated protein 3 FlgL
MNYEIVRDSIHRSKERMDNLQRQHATLRKVNTPSDDPIGAAKVLEIRTDKVNNEQFLTNAKLAETFLNNSDHVMAELSDIVMRAREIALGQASGASSNDDTRLGVAEEVGQLFKQAVAAANRRIGDRYLFGGYRTDKPPIDPEGRYKGDDGQMMAEISRDVFIAMNVPGLDAFNTNPKASSDSQFEKGFTKESDLESRKPASAGELAEPQSAGGVNVNVFDELQNLRIALLTGDLEGIRDTLDRFDDMQAKLLAVRAKIGSRIQGLQSTQQSLERHTITNSELASSIEDADMAQVVSDLAKEEQVFRSALQSSQKLLQPTLMEFLK